MSDENDKTNEGQQPQAPTGTPSTTGPRAPLSLKPRAVGSVPTGTVRQSFSHGRTKTVVVETKRPRAGVAPGHQRPQGFDVAARPRTDAPAAPQAPRPAIDTAALQMRDGQSAAAFETLLALSDSAPLALPLYAATLQQAAVASQRSGEALALLQRRYAASPSIDVLEAIIALGGTPNPDTGDAGGRPPSPRDGYIAHLARQPSLVAASRWLAGERFQHEQFHAPVQRALEQATRPLMRYRCAACGFEAHQYFWHCPGCQAWDSYPPRRVEEL